MLNFVNGFVQMLVSIEDMFLWSMLFWGFLFLVSVGMVAYIVSQAISDKDKDNG